MKYLKRDMNENFRLLKDFFDYLTKTFILDFQLIEKNFTQYQSQILDILKDSEKLIRNNCFERDPSKNEVILTFKRQL